MDKNPSKKDESITPSLMDLLKKYTTRVDERETLWKEGTRACRQQQKVQTDEIEKLKQTVNILQTKPSSISDTIQQIDDNKTNINYKTKWEESEAKCHQLEKKCRQLETGTIKQLQDKITQLERENNQIKVIKERIGEICSCRQLTNTQIDQLRLLINKTNQNNISIETIANKNDFHQQTIKLREILTVHNDELINKIDEMIKRKRKRDQYEEDLTDDDTNN